VVHLESAPHVTLRGLRILYFKKAGIYAYRSPHVTIEDCTFYNGPGWATGYHVFAFWSPHATISRCLAVGAEIGFYLLKSPNATLLHNTASQHMYAAVAYTFSAAGSTQMYNSFAYAGNDIFSGHLAHPDDLKTFRSDYNNLGTNVLGYHRKLQQEDPKLYALVKAEAFTPPKYPVHIRTSSKAVVGLGKRVMTLQAWRDATGQDVHTVFADPGYLQPYPAIDAWDWRVRADSPNQGVAPDGSVIGAFGVAPAK
jgi:hypothetical protein